MHCLWGVGGIIVNPDASGVRMRVNYLLGMKLLGTCEWMDHEVPCACDLGTGFVKIYDKNDVKRAWFKESDCAHLLVGDTDLFEHDEPSNRQAISGWVTPTIAGLIPVMARHQVAGTDIVKGLKARGLKDVPKFTRLHSGGWRIEYPEVALTCDWDGKSILGGLQWELWNEDQRLRKLIDSLDDQPAETQG